MFIKIFKFIEKTTWILDVYISKGSYTSSISTSSFYNTEKLCPEDMIKSRPHKSRTLVSTTKLCHYVCSHKEIPVSSKFKVWNSLILINM